MKTTKAQKRIANIRTNLTLLSALLKGKYAPDAELHRRSGKWIKNADKDIDAAVQYETSTDHNG